MSDRLVLHGLGRFANWNAEGSDGAAAGADEVGAWAVCSDAAPAHARAFYQEKERVSQELRLRGAGSLTEIRQAFALTHLKFLNHAKTGMALLGQFDRGVGKIAAAFVPSDEYCGLVHEAVKLTTGVPRILGFDFGPDFVRLSPFVVQILDNKLVLGIEMAVKRHLASARGLGDGFDSHPSNALAVEKVLCAVEDAVAGLPDPGNLYVRVRIRFFFVHGA